jgi:hypothetical protein
MRELLEYREQKAVQRLERAVAPHSLTQTGKEYSAEDKLGAALVILDAMSSELLSPDALYLAYSKALRKVPNDMDPAQWKSLVVIIFRAIDAKRRQNPISGMF